MISTAAALLAGQALSSAAQVYANNQNIDFQKEQNKMSENLANSAHQREVLDLLAAGLNPILSANGSGAATPNLHAPQVESIGKEAGNTARAIAQYENAQFKAGVEGQQLANQYQVYANRAADESSLASAKEAENARRMAELESDAIDKETGLKRFWENGRYVIEQDRKKYGEAVDLTAEGIRSEMKNRSNQNWRANLQAILGGAGAANSAASAVSKIKWLVK